ncbi:MAG: hypothetical protein LCH39_05250 [Proteobacteria bacterium]|nr:hypothetical protein [Pseudomonadota bacterium]
MAGKFNRLGRWVEDDELTPLDHAASAVPASVDKPAADALAAPASGAADAAAPVNKSGAAQPDGQCPPPVVEIIGTNESEELFGGAGADRILALDGDDQVDACDGDDFVYGGNGNDILNGGNGADTLRGGDGFDQIFGDAGDDLIIGDLGDDIIYGGDGNDHLMDYDGFNDLYGGAGNDWIAVYNLSSRVQANVFGGEGDDLIYTEVTGLYSGDTGNDTFYLRGRYVSVYTGDGADRVIIGPYPGGDSWTDNGIPVVPATFVTVHDFSQEDSFRLDWSAIPANPETVGYPIRAPGANIGPIETITSDGTYLTWTYGNARVFFEGVLNGFWWDAATDTFYANPDEVIGSDGNDVLNGTVHNDRLYGRAGNDIIRGLEGDDKLNGEDGDDSLYGGAGADRLNGGRQNDTIDGGDGADFLWGDSNGYYYGSNDDVGSDTIFGGAGDDNIWGDLGKYVGYTRYYWVEPSYGAADYIDGGDGDDLIAGQGGDDEIHGGAGDDFIGAGYGDDIVYGDAGNDSIKIGIGNDQVWGGTGNDSFWLHSNQNQFSNTRTVIHDFGAGDQIADREDGPYPSYPPATDNYVQTLMSDGLHMVRTAQNNGVTYTHEVVLLNVTQLLTFDTTSSSYHF